MANPKQTCPWCNGQRYKTLKKLGKGRVTRCCEKPIVTVAGRWYQTLDDAPEWRVIKKFVEMKQSRNGHYEIEFGDTTYQAILKTVTGMIARCGDDVDLALLVVELSFTHEQHEWRDYPAFYSVMSRRLFPDVLALARAEMAQRAAGDGVQRMRMDSVMPEQIEMVYATTRV